MTRLAEDIGLKYSTVNNARWVASRWPKEHRQAGVPFTVYRILASVDDEDERFAAVKSPPKGKARWTADDASRVLGWQVENPVSKQEKISAIHALAQDEEVAAVVTTDLLRRPSISAHVAVEDRVRVVEEFTRDESVAATVTTGLLRRPDVAFKALSDDTARHQVNHAQVERGRQARENFERTSPVAPAVKQINRTVEFLGLVTACHSFVAAAGRAVPGLRDRQLSEDEQVIVHQNIAKVRATFSELRTPHDSWAFSAARGTRPRCRAGS
ncbi:DUF6192 family protein [Streptomyces sp. NPDC002033]|uniref:DUF6192 family protein n=1 Tax=Streptomyces sp. NPDC002033 TaxID=3154533 RepID=UPI003325D2FB